MNAADKQRQTGEFVSGNNALPPVQIDSSGVERESGPRTVGDLVSANHALPGVEVSTVDSEKIDHLRGGVRTLVLLFRRDPSRDRQNKNIHFEAYEPLWPDGKPVAGGIDGFLKHGMRLLGLGKHLAGCQQKLVKLVCLPLLGREDDLNRIPGCRVRRFYLLRAGNVGRIHFMDGTPTIATFELGVDEPKVLDWIGLDGLADGEILWFDLAAVQVDAIINEKKESSLSILRLSVVCAGSNQISHEINLFVDSADMRHAQPAWHRG